MLPVNSILQGRYQIAEQIGRGGMGAVYRAVDLRLGHVVALKETLVAGDAARRAFEREARLLAGLRHRALPKVSDHFTEGEGQFLVMEFIGGDDLGSLIARRENPFPAAEVLRWADDLLDALEYLHGHTPPIVHRDIKPQNMKLTPRGEIILLDFGLAKGAASQATRSASTGSIYGYTPHYAPLEQIQGTGTDIRSDLYALAATMHHLLTGTPPPDALTRAAAKISDNPDPLSPTNQLNPDVPPAVAAVLMRAMSQKPDQRYATAAAMRAALRDAARGGQTAPIHDPATQLVDPAGTVVIYSGAETQAARGATGALPATGATGATGTTVSPPAAQAGRPGWLLPALIGIGVLLVVGALLFGGVFNRDQPATPTSAPAIAAAETNTPAPTATPAPTIDVLAAADATRTAEAVALATARVILGSTDVAATEQAIEATEQAIGPTLTTLALTPTEGAATPTAEPATNTPAPPTNTAPPAATRPPTRTPDPNAPTNTPRPTNTPNVPAGEVVSRGGGGAFRGSARRGALDDTSIAQGGSCVQGRVTASDGSLFAKFYVQVDRAGRTLPATHFYDTGNYRICGLEAGEWGVAVYAYNDIPTSGDEQRAHQVILRLSGQPGEIFYVDFQANFVPAAPTATPVPPTATPVPEASPYDGVWRGTNAGTTTTGEYPPGRFEIEVRNGAIYRVSVDGPSCFFESYPNFPEGIKINGNSFAVGGSVFNPITGAVANHTYNVSGTFVSTSLANGSLNATLDGVQCASATWNARK
jgi:hypothetical protein